MSRTFIISRTDSIGDVMLTLPVAGALRDLFPDARIIFLGRSYTEEIIKACRHIDEFLNWDEWKKLSPAAGAQRLAETKADTIIHVFPDRKIAQMAKQAGIPTRIGTTNRWYHWHTCNKLVPLSRKNSPYHEAQLNLKLLTILGAKPIYSLEEIGCLYGFGRVASLPDELLGLRDPERFNLIIHPKSKGSAREWGLDNFSELIGLLPADQFKIFITGTAAEGEQIEPLFRQHPSLTDLTGKLSLGELIAFISRADGLLAASTGPLHIAAALGIHAIGLFSPMRPIHPGRWAPVGKKTKVFVKDISCGACRVSQNCVCMRDIAPLAVKEWLVFVNLDHQPAR
jgi:heptosyltransferase III